MSFLPPNHQRQSTEGNEALTLASWSGVILSLSTTGLPMERIMFFNGSIITLTMKYRTARISVQHEIQLFIYMWPKASIGMASIKLQQSNIAKPKFCTGYSTSYIRCHNMEHVNGGSHKFHLPFTQLIHWNEPHLSLLPSCWFHILPQT